jgi:predicted DNA binding CopG/RHH family protein
VMPVFPQNNENNMKNEKEYLLNAIAKIPGLEILIPFLNDLPDTAAFEAMHDEVDALLDATLEAALKMDPEDFPDLAPRPHGAVRPSSPACSSKSKRITIRIPGDVLNGARAEARARCIPYQTLLNRTLRAAMAGWTRPEQSL